MHVRWDAPLITARDLDELRSVAREVVHTDPDRASLLSATADEIERLWRLVGS